MNYFIRTFPFSLLGVSAMGLWGNFYSSFFGLGFVIPILTVIFFVVSAFMDFYHITQAKTVPIATTKKEGRSVRKYVDAAPFSLGMLSMLSFLGAINIAGMKDYFDFWYALPAIIDLILIILAFRKFYTVSAGEESETVK